MLNTILCTVCCALHCHLDGVFVGFGSGLYGRIVGVQVGAGCAPLVPDLFLFCCEGDFVLSLSGSGQTDIIEAFNSTTAYLDDSLGGDNPYFEQVMSR